MRGSWASLMEQVCYFSSKKTCPNVLSSLRPSKNASWKAPGSNLEAPGPILETPSLHLDGFWNDFFEICGQNAKRAKNAQNACQNKTSSTSAPRVGGRRCSPPGGFQWNSPPGDLSFRKGRAQKYVRLTMCWPNFWWLKFCSAKQKK